MDTAVPTIHVMVALCDNQYQGIVPVPKGIGNGQQPNTNLYWGCGLGLRTYFSKSTEWQLLAKYFVDSTILERLIFKHRKKAMYLVADGYNGKFIKNCTEYFLTSSAGLMSDTLQWKGDVLGLAGNAKLLAYVGHDGLMDFQLSPNFINTDRRTRDVMMVACFGKYYFGRYLKNANVRPLIWSTGLMSAEAYTIHDAITAYVAGASPAAIQLAAANAYARYQHCSQKAAARLIVTGW